MDIIYILHLCGMIVFNLCRYSEKTKKSEIFAILTDEMQLKECSFFKILGDDIVIAFEDKGNLEKNPSLCVFNKKILDI